MNGIVVDDFGTAEGAVQQLARSIIELIDDGEKRARLGKGGRQTALSGGYTLEDFAKKYETLYESL